MMKIMKHLGANDNESISEQTLQDLIISVLRIEMHTS